MSRFYKCFKELGLFVVGFFLSQIGILWLGATGWYLEVVVGVSFELDFEI